MKERYPFFRDETERSLAVIGESAIEPDLNGQFEKPYAILTEKHLYCKNEMGNFIVETDHLQNAEVKAAPSMSVLSQAVFIIAAFITTLLIGSYYFSAKHLFQARIPNLLAALVTLGISFYLHFKKKWSKTAFVLLAIHSALCLYSCFEF